MSTHPAPSRGVPWRACLVAFAAAFAVRLFFLSLVPEDALRPDPDWELDAIAITLATRGEFADPYAVPTGPTAHLPPVPPLLLAGIVRLFGVSITAGIVAWLIGTLAQSAIWGMLPWIGQRVGLGWRAGLAGALAAAPFPQWLLNHGEDIAAVTFGLLVVAAVRRWESRPRAGGSLLLGAGFGFLFHVQPAFLPVLLGYLAFELWMRSDRRRWRSAGLVVLGAVIVCLPWGVRNSRALDAVFFVRSNFGLELRMGNHEGATASIETPHFRTDPQHPRALASEAMKVREMGEVPYMRAAGREARAWIGQHPGQFAGLTAERFGYFWLGPLDRPAVALLFSALTALAIFGAARTLPTLPPHRIAALITPLLAYPPVYYLVPWQQRYRFPIEWVLFLLAGAAVWSGHLRRAESEPREGEPVESR
ncbi:MAG: glycosyltransferase family 39 protein [Gemmatimonadota bacterium]